MPRSRFLVIIYMSLLLMFVYGCKKGSLQTETAESSAQEQEQTEHAEEQRGEHAGEGEHGKEGGESSESEEAGPRIANDGTHDEVRKGVRLILFF